VAGAGRRAAGQPGGQVWLRARTDAGWSGWRAVEPAADGPDANTAEYRRSERVYSDGLWLDAGTAQVQIRVDRPAPSGATGAAGSGPAGGVGSGTPNPAPSSTSAPSGGAASFGAVVPQAGCGRI